MKRGVHFFLGGRDLEMVTIRELLLEQQQPFSDRNQSWGATAGHYADLLPGVMAAGLQPVFIELENDLSPAPSGAIWVDHHGPRAGADAPTSLEQIFALLELPPSRWSRHLALVAANDRGYIPAMVALKATREEIASIRESDRQAQGAEPADEAAATVALQQLQQFAAGALTVAQLESDRTSPLVDRLDPALGGDGFRNLLLFTPNEINFFGTGSLVTALAEAFGGWYGGALPEKWFWGVNGANQQQAVQQFLLQQLAATRQ
ncbi:MAG: hypothetical protein HQL48_12030 [Gammaproteobacteria bacterium]|nr:hypothetical protein [Gammaproteobacteria bacterium]